MRKTLVVALVLAVAAAAYVISTKRISAPLPQPLPEITEIPPNGPGTTDPTEPSSSTGGLGEPLPDAQMSDEDRAVAIKRAISKSMAESRDVYANGLAASGLASADSAQIAQRFIDELADCLFEAARKEYEARGVGLREFLDGAEIAWSQPVESGIRNLSQLQSGAAPCIATASQQAGISMPANFGSAANDIVERFSAGLESPPWAGEMEDRIRQHIASYPAGTSMDVLASCREEGCSVMMVGRDIRVFDLEFDQFAERNGFQHAVLGGDSSRRFVWLER